MHLLLSLASKIAEHFINILYFVYEGRALDIIYLSGSKAFGTVSHSILAFELEYYDLDDRTTRWVKV